MSFWVWVMSLPSLNYKNLFEIRVGSLIVFSGLGLVLVVYDPSMIGTKVSNKRNS